MFFADPANESLYRLRTGRRMVLLAVKVYLVVVIVGIASWLSANETWILMSDSAGILDWLCLASRFLLGLAPFVLLPAVVLAVRNSFGQVAGPVIVSGTILESELVGAGLRQTSTRPVLWIRYSFQSPADSVIITQETVSWRYRSSDPPSPGTKVAIRIEEDGSSSLL